jgi:hypothetical protein
LRWVTRFEPGLHVQLPLTMTLDWGPLTSSPVSLPLTVPVSGPRSEATVSRTVPKESKLFGPFGVTLLDASETPLIQTAASAGVTVPKEQLPCTIKGTRINAEWQRPAAAGTLQLRFEGSGSVVRARAREHAARRAEGAARGRWCSATCGWIE